MVGCLLEVHYHPVVVVVVGLEVRRGALGAMKKWRERKSTGDGENKLGPMPKGENAWLRDR
jgi:hypothetical protein